MLVFLLHLSLYFLCSFLSQAKPNTAATSSQAPTTATATPHRGPPRPAPPHPHRNAPASTAPTEKSIFTNKKPESNIFTNPDRRSPAVRTTDQGRPPGTGVARVGSGGRSRVKKAASFTPRDIKELKLTFTTNKRLDGMHELPTNMRSPTLENARCVIGASQDTAQHLPGPHSQTRPYSFCSSASNYEPTQTDAGVRNVPTRHAPAAPTGARTGVHAHGNSGVSFEGGNNSSAVKFKPNRPSQPPSRHVTSPSVLPPTATPTNWLANTNSQRSYNQTSNSAYQNVPNSAIQNAASPASPVNYANVLGEGSGWPASGVGARLGNEEVNVSAPRLDTLASAENKRPVPRPRTQPGGDSGLRATQSSVSSSATKPVVARKPATATNVESKPSFSHLRNKFESGK